MQIPSMWFAFAVGNASGPLFPRSSARKVASFVRNGASASLLPRCFARKGAFSARTCASFTRSGASAADLPRWSARKVASGSAARAPERNEHCEAMSRAARHQACLLSVFPLDFATALW